jgi:hypothetical protein
MVETKQQLREKIDKLEARIIGMRMAACRMRRMTPQQRSDVARAAVNARWDRMRAAMVNPPLPKRRNPRKPRKAA